MTLACSAFAALLQPVCAAPQYDSFAAASQKVTDTGYMVFIYPSGWDRYGEKLCKKLIADEHVLKASGKAALLLAPIYQNSDAAAKEKSKKMMGSLGYPNDMSDISYPAIVFYEKGGRMFARICGEDLMNSTPKQVAELIKQKLQAKGNQDDLLKKAHAAASPDEKNRLFLESARVNGIEWPGGLQGAMRSADPDDKFGHRGALNFGFGIQNGESMDSILKRLDATIENERYTSDQKQRACAAVIGHIRRNMGMMAGGPLITKYARIMRKLNPESPLGLSAPVVMRDWVRQYNYGQGWSPEIIPGSEVPLQMINVPMQKPGKYAVTFKIVTGRDAVHVKQVRLLDGDNCIAEDKTARSVTWGATVQTFNLDVKKASKSPVLEIIFTNDADHKSTWGNITVTRQ